MSMSEREPFSDPPLNESGELELSDDLSALADCLRGDAARLADVGNPRAALPVLCQRATRLERSRTSGIAGILATTVLGCLALWGLWHSSAATRRAAPFAPATSSAAAAREVPAVTDDAPLAERGLAANEQEARMTPGETGEGPSVFLSAADSAIGQNAAAGLLDFATSEEKVQLLEEAVERYRSAVQYQQDQLINAQRQLREAEAEIRALRDQLERVMPAGADVPPRVEE